LASALRFLLLMTTLIAGPIAAHAAGSIITSTLGLPSSNQASFFGVGLEDAQVFQTNNQFWSLTSIVIRAGNLTGAPTVIAELRDDDLENNLPVTGVGNVITTFAIPDLSGALSNRTFLPNTSVTLKPGHRYWFALGTLSSEAAGQFDWSFADVNGPVTGPGTVPARFGETLDAGNSWTGFDETPYLIQVSGIALTGAAPEPPALALLAFVGIPAVGIVLRRRYRA
jgi:hypothetical protein